MLPAFEKVPGSFLVLHFPSPHLVKRSNCFSSSLYHAASCGSAFLKALDSDCDRSLSGWGWSQLWELVPFFWSLSSLFFWREGKVYSSYLSFSSYGKCRAVCPPLGDFMVLILMHETVESSVNKRKASLQTKAASEWQGEMRAQLGTHTCKQYRVILSTSCFLGELILTSELVNVDSALKLFFFFLKKEFKKNIKKCNFLIHIFLCKCWGVT